MTRRLLLAALLLTPGLAAGQAPARTEAETKALEAVRKAGGSAMELAQSDPRIEVAYHLAEGKLTAEHLAPLKALKQLVHLNLRGRDLDDALAAHLKDLTALTRLHLEKTKITDKGLEHLKGLTNLEYLNLYGTAVSDAGLPHLTGLKKLKSLYVWETKVTDAGVATVKKALPQLQVIRGLEAGKPKESSASAPKK